MSSDEKSLIARIEEAFDEGVESHDYDKLIQEARKHALTDDCTDEFNEILSKFGKAFRSHAEYPYMVKNGESIRATIKRKEGIFYLHDSWGKEISLWLNENPGKVQIIQELDDLYMSIPKSKPTKKWIASIASLYEKFGKAEVAEVVRQLITLLIERSQVKEGGLCYSNEDKLKVLLYVLLESCSEDDSEQLKELAIVCYYKIAYEGPVSTGCGNLCLHALSVLEGTKGLIALSQLAQQLKYPANAKKMAAKKLEEGAQAKGLNAESIEESHVPDFGLQ